jgi:hypothetical protein
MAQRPAHSLLDQVPFVGRCGPDERQKGEEPGVRGFPIVPGQAGDQREGGPLHELLLPLGPLRRFTGSEGCLVEQVQADLIADVPGVQSAHPGLHLRLGHFPRLVHDRGEDPCIRNAGIPEPQGEPVVPADRLGQGAQLRHRYSQPILRADPISSHVLQLIRPSGGFQPLHYLLKAQHPSIISPVRGLAYSVGPDYPDFRSNHHELRSVRGH